jgi:hypothetical protein
MYLGNKVYEAEYKLNGVSDLTEMFEEIVGQATSKTKTTILDELLSPAGRATLRAKPTPKGAKVVSATPTTGEPIADLEIVMEQAESLSGDESYARPNGQDYYARQWGEHTDIEVLRKAREANQFVMLYGSPGTGKTACVEAAFPDELYTILGSGDTEVSDLVGGYVQTPSGGFEWIDGSLVRAASEGKVLLIDEIGLIDPKVLSVVYGLMDGRKELTITANPQRGTIKAKDGFFEIGRASCRERV